MSAPNELSDSRGEVIWLADYEAWGNTAKVVWREEQLGQLKVAKEDLQPLRLQGQYYEEVMDNLEAIIEAVRVYNYNFR